MSQIKNMYQFHLDPTDRHVRLNGPEIAEIYGWLEALKETNTYLYEINQGVEKVLARGPIFDEVGDLIMNKTQVDNLLLAYDHVQPDRELSSAVRQILVDATQGKVRETEAERAAKAEYARKVAEMQAAAAQKKPESK